MDPENRLSLGQIGSPWGSCCRAKGSGSEGSGGGLVGEHFQNSWVGVGKLS
jgi:hypothetical protein